MHAMNILFDQEQLERLLANLYVFTEIGRAHV